MRKTRKKPFMTGSIRRHNKNLKDLKVAMKLEKWCRSWNCPTCVSEPICLESLIP